MENEIAQRATALGTLIEGLARREEFRGPRVARSEAGLTWGASGFVAALIRVAVVHSDAVSIDEAEAVVGAEKLRAMRDARYVRIRDGHVALRNELWRGGRPPEVDREAFSALREIIRDPDRQRLWISAELANAAYAAHAAAYPSTPPWTTLAVPPALTAKRYDDADGYDLGTVPSVGGSWLFTELERAAAQLWHEMLPQRDRSDDAGVLRRWLARVGGGAVDAARHLTNGARDRLLDAATRELLADPELGSLDEEMEWLLGPAYRADRELPTMSAEPTPAQIRLYWEDVERNRHCHVLDTSREHLSPPVKFAPASTEITGIHAPFGGGPRGPRRAPLAA